jgi:hypothetical protein
VAIQLPCGLRKALPPGHFHERRQLLESIHDFIALPAMVISILAGLSQTPRNLW